MTSAVAGSGLRGFRIDMLTYVRSELKRLPEP